MRVVDFTVSIEQWLFVLTAAGEILKREPPNDILHMHMPPSQRPEWVFTKIEGPEGVTPKRIIAAQMFDLHCIGDDGKLYRRQRDLKSMTGEKWRWHEVDLSARNPTTP
jgi:hypothetical protein